MTMDSQQLQYSIQQIEHGLRQLRQDERDAEDELTRRRDARLRQEGALIVLQQMAQQQGQQQAQHTHEHEGNE